MLAFACPVCAHLVTFESVRCLHCSSRLAYDPRARTIGAISDGEAGDGLLCVNARLASCNWLAPEAGALCASCSLTRTRPNDRDADGLGGFARAEAAKRRLLFELTDLGLPVESWRERDGGLAFDLLSSASEPVSTGHADGLITLDLAETDPARREPLRVALGESYRTVLGHLRHEIGHYYQPVLVPPDSEAEPAMRELFGDERADYKAALRAHYSSGPTADWQQRYVSAYATMHPWEDWAETFAHYLHIRDTLQTAAAYGVVVEGPAFATADEAPLESDPAAAEGDSIARMLAAWIPLTFALNAISRSMGAQDTYPFVLAPAAMRKLEFVGRTIERASLEPVGQRPQRR
ncbi:MAG: hypothetical protein JWM60_379 [Solirubrobacterales bacterium]|nr:hypothetical protein [Solirubrobacterales bacterium]